MINLFFSSGAAGGAHLQRRKLGIQYETITSINLNLFAGNITEPYNISLRREVYNAHYDLTPSVSEQMRKLKKLLKNDKSLCLWFSQKNTDEYLGMLATVHHFDNKGIVIYLCDCTVLYDCLFELQMRKDVNPIERHILSLTEKELFLLELKRLQSENTMLRITKNGKVISIQDDYYDNAIFDFIGDKEVKVVDICKYLIENKLELSDKYTFILMRIKQLIAENKIILVKEVYDNNDGYYGKPMKNIMKYLVKNFDNDMLNSQ